MRPRSSSYWTAEEWCDGLPTTDARLKGDSKCLPLVTTTGHIALSFQTAHSETLSFQLESNNNVENIGFCNYPIGFY
jgi:hypothetical protein